jgi:p-cumate 2,3-dioxygenase alpha subunit
MTYQTDIAGAVRDERDTGRFLVHRGVFVDDAVLAQERERIFQKCWLYIAHASELKPGAFLTREVGGHPLILSRDRDGKLHCFYNTCSHRGAMVCRERTGSRRVFTCPYHAWSFDLTGKMVGMPGADAFPTDPLQDSSLDLTKVERLDEFKGFIFVCFDAAAVSLTEYLGGAAEYLAYVADHGPAGMEIVGSAQEYSVAANWKLLQENSADSYHGLPTHSTYFDYLRSRDGGVVRNLEGMAAGGVKNLGNGHAVIWSIGSLPWGRPYARWVPGWGEECRTEIEALSAEIHARLGPERGQTVAHGDRNLLIFPNLVVNDIMAVTVRTFYPTRSDFMQVNSWTLGPVGESDASRERRLGNYAEFLGPAGFATPDDVEMLESAQRGYANYRNASWNDYSRGTRRPVPLKTDELQMRTFWRRWAQLMTGDDSRGTEGP